MTIRSSGISRAAGPMAGDEPSPNAAIPPAEMRHRLLTALTRLHGAAIRSYNRLARDAGVPFEQWLVLAEMRRHESVSMGALTKILGFNFSTLTRIVDRMVNSSLIYRQVDPQDRRKVVMVLTDEGRDRLDRIDRQLDDILLSTDTLVDDVPAVVVALTRLARQFPED